MKVIVDFCLIPLGGELSLSPYIAQCQNILQEMGLEHELHAYGTNIAGDWDRVMAAVKRCHTEIHEMGAPRINTTLKVGTRIDREQSLAEKVNSVRALTTK